MVDVTVENLDINEEKVETIGAFLKQVRQKKKISMDKVASDLCIRKVYIKAIEESNYKELPAVPYGIGFVRTYAGYLGLNVERVVQLYKDETVVENDNMAIFEPQSEITYPSKQYVIGGIIAAFFVYLVYMLMSNIPNAQKEFSEEEMIIPTVFEQDVIINEEDDIKADIIEDTELVPEEEEAVEDTSFEEEQKIDETPAVTEDEIVVKVKGETWLQIEDSDNVYISKIVNSGFEYKIPGKKGIIFSVGRYYNVDVYINGKLTEVATKKKQTNILLDSFLSENNH